MNKFTDALMAFGSWAANNKYLGSIRDAFMSYMPLTIIGAMGTLWTYVIVDGTSGLGAIIPAVQKLSFLNPLFNALNFCTIGCITLGICFLLGSNIGERNHMNPLYSGVVAVAALLIVTCSTVDPSSATVALADGTSASLASLLPEGAAAGLLSAIATKCFGSAGLFTGMIIAVLSVELLNFFNGFDKLKIKLPDTVPPNVAESFSTLIPSFLAILSVGLFGFIVNKLTGLYLNDLIYSLVQAPLQNVGGSFLGGLIFIIVITLFWCVGLHGNNMTSAITTPLLTALLVENEAAVQAGEKAVNIVNHAYWSCFVTICGTGIALAVSIAILIACKRDDNRAIAKLSLFPNLFNINETVVFGLPVVLNPPMCVGFVLAPCVSYIVSYVLTAIGFCPVMYINIPWTTPILLSGFLASGGNIMGAVTQLICLACCVLVYIPCVRIHEKQQMNAEKNH